MDEQFIRDRITALRQQKGISERKMSLDTPSEFFNVGQELDPLRQEVVDRMKGMSAKEVEFLLGVIQLMQKG